MSDVATTTLWAAVSGPNPRSKRRYIDYGSLSYTRSGAIAKHCEHFHDPAGAWPRQRKRGWTAERVMLGPIRAIAAAEETDNG